MGFKSVYRTLQELFPQVDARLLKAAAIEHSKDPDGAVEFILTEVFPYSTKQSNASSSINGSFGYSSSELVNSTCASPPKHASTSFVGEAANVSGEMNEPHHMDLTCLNERANGSLESTFCDAKDIGDEMSGNSGTRELTASEECEDTGARAVQDGSFYTTSVSHTSEDITDDDHNQKSENNGVEDSITLQKPRDLDLPDIRYSSSSSSTVLEDAVPDVCLNDKQLVDFDSCNDPLSGSLNGSVLVDSQKKRSFVDSDSLHGSNYVELASLSIKDCTLDPLDCSIQSEVHSQMSASNLEIPDCNVTADGVSREDTHVADGVVIEESSSVHSVVTRSGQLCSIDLLQEIIEDSKSHKKTLFSAMESILNLMREVEHQEKVAQQAKEEALKGGLDIIARADELKSMLKHAREANDMHSGEVYGERAILATEMRELQSRLLGLSDEKDKSISMLETMQRALEARLAAAEAERIAAEQEKLEKEESARKALAEQELIMEKVVQESKTLQHEAEENAKLREFLMERGRVVDMLQGEICVICQDVQMLKEKFDNRASLSECLSSKHTSCILASSRSSLKSTGSDEVLEQAKWSALSDEPILLPLVKQVAVTDQDELVDDEGWELFDNAA